MPQVVDAEVVVVGGGPVGMLIAAELGLLGTKVLVLETRAAVSERPKANTLHARAVQSLARRGYVDALAGVVDAAPQPFHFAGIQGLQIAAPEGEPSPILKLAQAELERALEQRALAHEVTVLRSHEVTQVSQDPDGVRVVANTPHGTKSFSALYLVGADGSASRVREQAGFATDTSAATVSALMGQVRFAAPDTAPRGWQRTPRGWVVCRPESDGTGVIRTLNFAAPADWRARPTLDELRTEVRRILERDVPMTEALFLSRFSDYTQVARTFRLGRVFLAGDAAHIHFPIGGQGLSTGIGDGFNLAWKLAHAVRTGSGDQLLDSYDLERRPVVEQVVRNTRAQLALMRPGAELDPLRELFARILPFGEVSAFIGGALSAQETVCSAGRDSACEWTGRFLPNQLFKTDRGVEDVTELLRAGRPLMLYHAESGQRHASVAQGWSHVLRTVRVHGQRPLSRDALLVRPDGYIAWTSASEDLAVPLHTWFGQHR
ncbi:FAD-dependent monooxygenase [Streptomyces sp. NPDC126514]|uniref:FAD-dependent monooxygenase n=1 Tax=Streptomyces sp. NPDC126514 TaxID=3155210 RepID=UPI00331D3EB9